MTLRSWQLAAGLVLLVACGEGVVVSDANTSGAPDTTTSRAGATENPQDGDDSTSRLQTSTVSPIQEPSLTANPDTTDGPVTHRGSVPTDERVPSGDRVPSDEVPADVLGDIITDAADRIGADPEAIVIAMARAVDWPDASLGCPEPGVAYAQSVVAGYHVQLVVGQSILDYRADAAGAFFLCEHPASHDTLPGDERIDPPPPDS